jgi:hypothetical protein
LVHRRIVSTSPSPSRLRRAWQGGARAESAWLAAGLACVALAGAVRWSRPGRLADHALVGEIAAVLREPHLDRDRIGAVVGDVVAAGLGVALGLAVVAIAASVLAAAVLGRLGPVRPAIARGLGLGVVPQRLRIAVGGAAFVAVLLAFDLQRRIAGAARAGDATEDSLGALWFDGGTATLMAAGVAMIAAGTLEALQQRADRRVAAIPTPEQASDEARRSGGRRP